MIRETKESDLEEVFNLIYSAFGNQSESDLVRQLIIDEEREFLKKLAKKQGLI